MGESLKLKPLRLPPPLIVRSATHPTAPRQPPPVSNLAAYCCTMRIRPARPNDATPIARVHVASWRHAYRGRMPDALLDGLSIPDRATTWTLRLQRDAPGYRYRVAESDGTIIGFASIGPARGEVDCGELYTLYVDPARIGTGVGRALLADAEEGLRALGHTRAILWVLDDNPRARRVYAAAGWVPDGGEKAAEFGGRMLREVRYRLQIQIPHNQPPQSGHI
ncbi:MAG: GNAT superfamily N-acetyltransferase [Myxococcota bacterium]|jgi:GNAT superfamily N-acetyltransferase